MMARKFFITLKSLSCHVLWAKLKHSAYYIAINNNTRSTMYVCQLTYSYKDSYKSGPRYAYSTFTHGS